MSKGKFKSKEQKSAIENMKLLYKRRQVDIKIFNEYSLIHLTLNAKQNMQRSTESIKS